MGSSTHRQLVGSQGAVRLQATSETIPVGTWRSRAHDNQEPNDGSRVSAVVPHTGGRIHPRPCQAALLAVGVDRRQLSRVQELAVRWPDGPPSSSPLEDSLKRWLAWDKPAIPAISSAHIKLRCPEKVAAP